MYTLAQPSPFENFRWKALKRVPVASDFNLTTHQLKSYIYIYRTCSAWILKIYCGSKVLKINCPCTLREYSRPYYNKANRRFRRVVREVYSLPWKPFYLAFALKSVLTQHINMLFFILFNVVLPLRLW